MKILQKLDLPVRGEVAFSTPSTELVPPGAKLLSTQRVEVFPDHRPGGNHDHKFTSIERHYDVDGDGVTDVLEKDRFEGDPMRLLETKYLFSRRTAPGQGVLGHVSVNPSGRIAAIDVQEHTAAGRSSVMLLDQDGNGRADRQSVQVPGKVFPTVYSDLDGDGEADTIENK